MKKLDAVGKQCPIPVIMSKQEVKAGTAEFSITVDNEYSVENLKNFAESANYKTSVSEDNSIYTVVFTKDGETPAELVECDCGCSLQKNGDDWAVFVNHDILGDGSKELGTNLVRMFFYTLTQDENVPKYILFMNSGVNLALCDEQVIEHLKVLEQNGSEIHICGTCKNYFKIEKEPVIGRISNMYDITECMKKASKVVTL